MVKSKKQCLIVIGAFVLVLMLFTTTYAFFNYTRTGSNNVIKVGRIYFDSEQGNSINLTNVFPIDKTNVDTDNGNVGSVTIHVTGDTTYSDGIEYLVSVVDVNNTIENSNKTIPISVEVSYDASENKSIGESDNDYFTNRGENTSLYKLLNNRPIYDGSNLVVGYIKPDATGIDGSITIKAYLDKDKIAISDTYPEGTQTEIVGENTYGVNPNMTEEEFNACITYFEPEIRNVVVNPNPTTTEVNNCVTYFSDIGMENNTQNGETLDSFCDGTGTYYGMTLQQFVNGSSSSLLINDLVEINILIDQTDNQLLEDFCHGIGEINGTTLQNRLDNGYFSSNQLTQLKNAHIINQLTYQTTNSWTDGTTSSWVNGRTIFSTTEWNSFQENGVSFKIKVEANEGLWLNPFASETISNVTELEDVAGAKRYVGTSPNNYVIFNNEQWRIVGVYEDSLKIIRAQALTNKKPYNSSFDYHAWYNSNLETYLNEEYYNSLSNDVRNMIVESDEWYVGEVLRTLTKEEIYANSRLTTWTGKVGVIAAYEYLYSKVDDNSWIIPTTSQAWTINPDADANNRAISIREASYLYNNFINNNYNIYPVVYLKPEVTITGGTGELGGNEYTLGYTAS